ncbi:hypothetical protein CMUS01_06047 [Colletotrichum musicola]|uniref:Uncharacterized protein n=1 Tax=Colletotrichum musicola TaxID=2175873 RepID=A0A8H6KNT0_9PEZI|nr:hypothetical protein CMUS01_06047 [Colletotrichum musicola]
MSYYRSISDLGPKSFLFYVVAQIGPARHHRPVAVALRDDQKLRRYGFSGVLVVEACLQVIKFLSSPANRVTIEAELALARAFYASRDGELERSHLPEPSAAASSELGILGLDDEEDDFDQKEPGDEPIPQFPFISTTLLLGLSCDPSRTTTYSSQLQPLGIAFRDDIPHHGMVVVDISDLDRIRYGIVAFTLHHMAMVNAPPDRDYDPVEDYPPERSPDPVLEEQRLHTPLSANSYMKKFSYRDHENGGRRVKEVELRHWVVDPSTMDFIWPSDDIDSESHLIIPKTDRGCKSLGEQSIRSLIEATWQTDNDNMFTFDGLSIIPGFRDSLRRQVLESPQGLGPTLTSAQLLRVMYEKQDDLNWVQFKNISYETVATAIESAELRRGRSLSLCVDRMKGDPETLLQTLCRLETGFQTLCFLQEPRRVNDDASASIYVLISTKPEYTQLLLSKDITVTAAYSAPLRKSLWLPTSGYSPPVEAFPVQQMFVQHATFNSDTPFTHECFYLGGGLLGPGRFAMGFLAYLRSFGRDEDLLSFSCAPDLDQDYSDVKITPALADITASMDTRCYWIGPRENRFKPRDDRSRPRDVEEGSWTVLVSHERHDPDLNPPTPLVLRYAFVRARRRIAVGASGPAFGPGDVEVCDLAGFLRATTPHVDAELALRQLEILAEEKRAATAKQLMNTKYPRRLLPQIRPGMSWVSAFHAKSAFSILCDFLREDARD